VNWVNLSRWWWVDNRFCNREGKISAGIQQALEKAIDFVK
jgi:hypothetical protein